MNLNDKVIVSPQVLVSQVDDELIILDLTSNMYFGLNSVGAQIWYFLSQDKTIAETCEAMLAKYDASPESMERDVLDLTNELLSKNLVTRKPLGQSQSVD